jgi:hypothetical protein
MILIGIKDSICVKNVYKMGSNLTKRTHSLFVPGAPSFKFCNHFANARAQYHFGFNLKYYSELTACARIKSRFRYRHWIANISVVSKSCTINYLHNIQISFSIKTFWD